MKAVLCNNRPPFFARRQDGFNPLPPEGRYDIVATVEIPDGTSIVSYEGNYYTITTEFISDIRVFEKGVFAEAKKVAE